MNDLLSYKLLAFIGSLIFGMLIGTFFNTLSNKVTTEIEVTSAQPIHQAQIGDDTTPDILIIYKAVADGVIVYPTVIKEHSND